MKLVAFFLLASISIAFAQQPIVGGSEGSVSNGTVDAGLGAYGSQIAAGGPNDTNFSPIPAAGVIDRLYVSVAVSPGVGNSRTFTLRKVAVDQSLTCTIADAATTCSDTSNSFSNAAGDVAFVRISGTGAPAAASGRWSVRFTPTTTNQTVMLARDNLLDGSATNYIPIPSQNTMGHGATETDFQSLVGAGSMDAIYFSSNGSPGVGTNYAFSLSKNAAAQAVTCSVTGAATTCNDTAHSFSVSDGDKITIRNDPTSSPGAIRGGFGYRFIPSTSGGFYFSGGTRLIDNATTAYLPPNGRLATVTAEADALAVAPMNFWITKISILTGDPSPGSRAFTLRVNGANTALSCTVTSGNTTCSNSSVAGIAIVTGDTFTISDVSAASANTGRPVTLLVAQSSAPSSISYWPFFDPGGL